MQSIPRIGVCKSGARSSPAMAPLARRGSKEASRRNFVWRWRVLSLVSIAVAVLAFAACGGQEGSGNGGQENGKLESMSLRLKWLHQSQHAGFYAAAAQGFYKQRGLDVTLRPGGPDFPAVTLVAAGSEDFGVTGADQILLARAKGVPVVAVAVIYRKTPFVLMTRPDGPTSMSELRDTKVGVKFGGNEELTYRAMLAGADLTKDDVKEVPVKFDLGPFLNGAVEAFPGYVINEVLAAREAGVDVNVISPSDVGVELYADTLFTTEKEMRENPDKIRRFVQASLDGWAWALKNPDDAAALALSYDKNLKPSHEEAQMKASIPLVKPDQRPVGYMDMKGWKALQDLLIRQGLLEKKLDLNDAFTTEFIGRQ
jgi:NitT/TauT family transport system substrate-binding protein